MSAADTFVTLLGSETPPAAGLIDALLAQADGLIRGYLCREALPAGLDATRAMLALTLFNRMGAEGESSRREGDINSTFETLPEAIRLTLRPYRLARAAFSAPETET
jgi:hypothetical protein